MLLGLAWLDKGACVGPDVVEGVAASKRRLLVAPVRVQQEARRVAIGRRRWDGRRGGGAGRSDEPAVVLEPATWATAALAGQA